MSKGFKSGLVISGLFIVVGIGITIGGVSLGGLKEGVVGIGMTVTNGLHHDTHGTRFDTGTIQEERIDLEPFTSIEADIATLSIKIVQGDSYHMTIQNGSNYFVAYEVMGDVLKIKHEVDTWYHAKGEEGEIVITVPQAVTLDVIDLEQGVGEISLQEVCAVEVVIEGGMGDLSLENTVIQTLSVDSGMGDVSSNGLTCYELEMEVGMGDVDLAGSFLGDIDIEAGMGDVVIQTTQAHTDYNYVLDNGLGEVRIDGAAYNMMMNDIEVYNSADKTMTIEAGMGDVVIETSRGVK